MLKWTRLLLGHFTVKTISGMVISIQLTSIGHLLYQKYSISIYTCSTSGVSNLWVKLLYKRHAKNTFNLTIQNLKGIPFRYLSTNCTQYILVHKSYQVNYMPINLDS